MKIKICAVQMSIAPWQPEENLRRAKEALKAAHQENCQIICFPELFLTGPLGRDGLHLAQTIPGAYTEEFSHLAKTYNLQVIMGTIVERDGERFYNTSVLFDDSGRTLGKYRKRKLWSVEKTYITPGNTGPVFETQLGKIGLAICWDLAFPEVIKSLALRGAQIIFCPSFWLWGDKYGMLCSEEQRKRVPEINTEAVFVDTCVAARAIENAVAFVYVNGTGVYQTAHFIDRLIGRTQIAVPFYGTVAHAEERECSLVEEIDLSLIELAEQVYELREDSELCSS